MRVSHSAAILASCLFLVPGGLVAEGPSPEPPLVVPLPDRCTWTIRLDGVAKPKSRKSAGPTGERRIIQIENVKTGKIRYSRVTDNLGVVEDFYHIGEYSLFVNKTTGQGQVIGGSSFPIYQFFSPGLYGMDHVRAADFQKTVKLEGEPCHYYKGKFFKAAEGPDDEGREVVYEAWIAEETRLPVAYKEGADRLVYQFALPRGTNITLPPALEMAWNKVQNDKKILQRSPD